MAREGAPNPNDPTTYSAEAASSRKSDIMSIMSRSTISTVRSFAFESVLRKSRPYKRKELWDNASMISFGVESVNICSWTLLSELTLGELSTSEISVFELPIFPTDVWNAEHYDFSNNAQRLAVNTEGSQGRSALVRTGTLERPLMHPFPRYQPLPFIRFRQGLPITDGLFGFPAMERYARHNGAMFTLGRPSRVAEPPNLDSFSSFVSFPLNVVSKTHCKVWYDNGKWYLKNSGNNKATFLNHVRLSTPREGGDTAHELKHGDLLQLGNIWKWPFGNNVTWRCLVEIQIGHGEIEVKSAPRVLEGGDIPEETPEDLPTPLDGDITLPHEGERADDDTLTPTAIPDTGHFQPADPASPASGAESIEASSESSLATTVKLDSRGHRGDGPGDEGVATASPVVARAENLPGMAPIAEELPAAEYSSISVQVGEIVSSTNENTPQVAALEA